MKSLRMTKLRKAVLGVLAATTLGAPTPARAEALPELVRYLETEIARMDAAVGAPVALAEDPGFHAETASRDALLAVHDDEGWCLRNFRLRLRARAGFRVPGLVSFVVMPETELFWTRSFPEGWTAYKPRSP